MRKLLCLFLALFFVCSCKQKETKNKVVIETKAKTVPQEEWKVLFDGTNLDNWTEYLKSSISENWKLENGAMVFYPPVNKPKGVSYNLVTKSEYTNFVLSLEWQISEGGNSGIFWGVKEKERLPEAYQTGPEIQVLDNVKHPDAKVGTTHQAGALYDMVSPSKDVTKPIGEWNSCQIMVNHKTNKGNVVLNGETIVEFPVNNPEWGVMVAKSKFGDWPEFGKYATGKIGLQDHGDKVAFRNIKIKEL
ncbi:DUF1080 domain-containing protein [uncultured Maribacter sp.]|uniref:3-keto-disaccharide hydrolase n=1 Tax=uncultured Maribacter sp. TaxID=431308 RepID=UPI0026124B2A|nr:DUF1080 domain-containing protein [uncultured Maribacter sp.]